MQRCKAGSSVNCGVGEWSEHERGGPGDFLTDTYSQLSSPREGFGEGLEGTISLKSVLV